nr:MAG TPA: hypothetical protein [Caudoviricetes sp.]
MSFICFFFRLAFPDCFPPLDPFSRASLGLRLIFVRFSAFKIALLFFKIRDLFYSKRPRRLFFATFWSE